MNKKLTYINYLNLYKQFNLKKDQFLVFTHSHYVNNTEALAIKSLLQSLEISSFKLRTSILEKIIKLKNQKLKALLNGPSKIFLFSNFESFLLFSQNSLIKKKFIFLSVWIDNIFFSYPFFFNYIKNIKKSMVQLSLPFIANSLFKQLIIFNQIMLKKSVFILTNFLFFLNLIISKK